MAIHADVVRSTEQIEWRRQEYGRRHDESPEILEVFLVCIHGVGLSTAMATIPFPNANIIAVGRIAFLGSHHVFPWRTQKYISDGVDASENECCWKMR